MTSIDSEAPPIPKQIYLRTSNLTSDSLDSENDVKDTLKMDAVFDPFFAEMDDNADSLPGSMSKNASDANANLQNSAATVNRHLFLEQPQENGSDIAHDMEYLVSSSEENTSTSAKNSLDYSPLSPNKNGDVLFESADEEREESFTISCQPDESLGLVLGMNEIIDSSAREVRKVYVKKISLKGAMIRAMNETNTIRLGDEILAINETQIKSLSRTECLNLLIDLPNKITFLLRRNTVPWTTGPRCSFYLNLVDKNPESILSPAPKLFTNEGKKIPDGYKLLEVSLYREVSDLLGISIVPSYGHTRHYYQIKEFDPDGICFKSKLLNKGDFLVSCNGNSLYKIPLNQCLNILKSEGPSLTFEVFRKDDSQTVLESQETRPIHGDSGEVNNNVNDNNDNAVDAVRSENCLASELLVATEIRPVESVKPLLKTNAEDILLEQTVFESSDPKLFTNSTDISKFNTSSDFKYPQILELEIDQLNTSHLISDSQALLKSSVNHSEQSLDINTSPDLLDFSNVDHKKFPDISDPTSTSELNGSDSKLLPDFGHSSQLLDLNSSDFKPSSDISDSAEIFKSSISDFKPLPDFNDSSNLLKLSNGDLKTSTDFSDSTGTLEFINSDSEQSQLISDSPDLLESKKLDSHTSQTIGDLPELSQWNVGNSKPLSDFSDSHDLSRFDNADSQPHPGITDPKIPNSHSSSFEFELKENLSKPLLDFLTGSPSVGSSNGLQEPINACPAEPSVPPVVDDTCVQLTAKAVQSSPTADWSSQLNMSEQSLDEEHFSLDGLAEFSNHLNNANELNNNFSTGYPSSSNEDLISIDADVLSPVISNPALTYSNHARPWEAAGEAKSETLLPELQRPQSANQKNALNEFLDTVESPDYGSDPMDGLHDNIIQVDRVDKTLQSRPSNFHSDVSKGFNARLSSNTSLCSDLVEEERTSPMSYDDSFYGSTGIHTTDESDIPLSSRNSDNDLIEEMSALSPDSGMADSSGENFYDRENFIQKGPPLNLECSNASDDPDKLTDEETTLYHTISDVSKNAKVSGKHGSFDSSSDSCGTSVGSFESCAETGEQDQFGPNNSKPFNSRNEEATMKQTKSLPRNAFSDFKEFQNSMKTSSKPDAKLFSFNEIRASTLTMNPSRSDLNTFSTNLFSRKQRHERKSDPVRTEDKPFQVEVLKGIIGLGMTLKADDQGFVKVTHIQNNSPIGRNGIIKVGDCILEINNTDTVGVDDSRVQQILRLLPRGLIKVVASAVPITDWKKYTEDDSSNMSSSLKITDSTDASSATSPVSYQETNPTGEKSMAPSSPVLFTKTVSQFTNTTTKVETPSSPVASSFQQSSTFWSNNQSTEQEAHPTEKSSVSPSSAVKVLPVGEPKLQSALAKTLFSVRPSDFSEGVEDKPKAVSPSSPTTPSKDLSNGFDPLKVISAEMPGSPVTKLPDVQEENLTSSLSMNTWSSNRSVIPETDTKSLSLSSPVSEARTATENQAALSPTASRPTLHLESLPSDSDQTSPTSLSPRRFANRKLPDIFQSSHTFRSPSSPNKMRTFSEIGTPSEIVPSIQEHKSQKIVEASNSDVALSRSISVEPKTASNLTDLKLKSHSIEIIDTTPRTEVAVSQSINVEPRKSLDLSEVKVDKLTAQAMEDAAKPEFVSMQFSDVKPKSTDSLSERKAKTGSAAFVEDIAKPQVAVSQFIGIKPTTASNLSTKELKDNKNTSRPETLSMENAGSPKKQEQNIKVLAEVTSPKAEVAVSKSISLQPATATGLSEPVKRSRVSDIKKEPTKSLPSSSSTTTTTVKARLASMKNSDVVTSSDPGRPSFLRHKSTDGVILRRANTETNTSSSQDQPYGRKVSRYAEKARPKTEIFSKDIPSVFSKRKWCISTKSGQTNFAVPSEPESIEKVIQLGLIDEDDLDRLLTNANFALDKMSFSNKEEIHIAILEKDATEKIGIRLKKGDKQELLISLLEPDGAAVKQNFIHIGDALLLVNGKPAWNQTVMDVKVWLQTIETRIILVLCRHPMNEEETANDCEYLDIILHKGVTGIGFCLEGGIGCPLGDRPISVKRIFKGGPAEKDGQLKVGDEILKVNDMDFQKQRHFIAWNHLKFLPVGDVKLHICRRKSQAPKSAQILDTSTEPEADASA